MNRRGWIKIILKTLLLVGIIAVAMFISIKHTKMTSCLEPYAIDYCEEVGLQYSKVWNLKSFECKNITGNERQGFTEDYSYFYFTSKEINSCKESRQ